MDVRLGRDDVLLVGVVEELLGHAAGAGLLAEREEGGQPRLRGVNLRLGVEGGHKVVDDR